MDFFHEWKQKGMVDRWAMPIIYVVSDSVGETAELVTKAAISQFNGGDIIIKRFPYVEDIEQY